MFFHNIIETKNKELLPKDSGFFDALLTDSLNREVAAVNSNDASVGTGNKQRR